MLPALWMCTRSRSPLCNTAGQGRRGKALQPQSDEESEGLHGIAADSDDEEGDAGGAVSAAISSARQQSRHQASSSASQVGPCQQLCLLMH